METCPDGRPWPLVPRTKVQEAHAHGELGPGAGTLDEARPCPTRRAGGHQKGPA